MKNPIELTYEETELLANLLSKEITELGVERDPRFLTTILHFLNCLNQREHGIHKRVTSQIILITVSI